tara:strand:+ start:843 stop:1028 length:186 start_codon:yes stop_codon:yes gene_type:complete
MFLVRQNLTYTERTGSGIVASGSGRVTGSYQGNEAMRVFLWIKLVAAMLTWGCVFPILSTT